MRVTVRPREGATRVAQRLTKRANGGRLFDDWRVPLDMQPSF